MEALKLIEQYKNGEERAFDQLVRENYGAALQRAKRYMRTEEAAKDMVQEALIQAFLGLDSLRDKSSFRAWLLGIVRNTCLNQLRSEKIFYIELEEEQSDLIAEETDDEVNVLIPLLREAIQKLKDKDREIIEEYYFQGFSIKEIAEHKEISVGTAKVRLHRARRALEKLLLPVKMPRIQGFSMSVYAMAA